MCRCIAMPAFTLDEIVEVENSVHERSVCYEVNGCFFIPNYASYRILFNKILIKYKAVRNDTLKCLSG